MDKYKQLLSKFLSDIDLAKIEKGDITIDDAFKVIQTDVATEAVKKAKKEIEKQSKLEAAAMVRSQVEKDLNKKFDLNLNLSEMDEKGRMSKVIDAVSDKFTAQKTDFDNRIEAIKESAKGESAEKIIELQTKLNAAQDKAISLEANFERFKTDAETAKSQAIEAIHAEYSEKAKAAKQKQYFNEHIESIYNSDEFKAGNESRLSWSKGVTTTMIETELNRNGWNYKAVETDNGKITHTIVDKEGNLVKIDNTNKPQTISGLLMSIAEREKAIKKSKGKEAKTFDMSQIKNHENHFGLHPDAIGA